jgi:nucleotide-binding universal stress UspA family protein
MTDPFKLLIAYDGSPGSDEAIDDLQRAGLPANVEARVLSVADTWVLPQGENTVPQPALPNAMMRQARASATAMIDAAANQAERGAARVRQLFPHWKVTAESAAKGPAWAITLTGEEWGADLIVVGSRGYSQLQRWVLGSVSHAVLSHARCSVRVVRGRPTQQNRPLRILVAVDGSQEAEYAVQVVSERVWPAGTEIRLIMVLNPAFIEEITSQSLQRATAAAIQTAASDRPGEPDDVERMIVLLLDAYTATIEQNQSGVSGSSATVSTSLLSGEPRRVLLDVAQEWGADCIFIGSRGLNRWERLLLGSTSLAVTEGATCPVEVVRKPMR